MDYVFGKREDGKEILKTKGSVHSELSGWRELERVYPDQTITDQFLILGHLHEDEDAEGNCYDWYEIGHHNRYTDKTGPVKQELDDTRAELEDALCEQDEAMEERIATIEDALCEIDMEGE